MSTPIIILAGPAGVGKDTVAEIICKNYNGLMVAQADPMKRFAQAVFGFSVEQLWGPSDCRNAPDQRYADVTSWDKASDIIGGKEVAPSIPNDMVDAYSSSSKLGYAHSLREWFAWLDDRHHNNDAATRILTPRYCLQTLGTEWGRKINHDMWSNFAIETAFKLLRGGARYYRTLGIEEAREQTGPDYVVITDGRFRNELLNVKKNGGVSIGIVAPMAVGLTEVAGGVPGHVSESELKGIPTSFYDARLVNDKSHGLKKLEDAIHSLMQGNKPRRTYYTSLA